MPSLADLGSTQDNWRWCPKCQGLSFAGNSSQGPCPAGGSHDHSGSGNYRVLKDINSVLSVSLGALLASFGIVGFSEQDNWRWCPKCQGLSFAGNSSQGPCPAGGSHDHSGSGNYVLLKDLGKTAATIAEIGGQDNWRWCPKCQGLAYAGNSSQGPCPAGGSHEHTGSGNYTLITV
jgi:hypothetical protein